MSESDETAPPPNVCPIFLTTIFVRLLAEGQEQRLTETVLTVIETEMNTGVVVWEKTRQV